MVVAAVTCIAAPVIASGSPAGGATAGGPTTNVLSSVSCVSATVCFAVGASYVGPNAPTNNPSKTLAARWSGKSWSVLPSPDPAGATSSVLSGVSCASSSNCFAVGSFAAATNSVATLIERWNGKTWSIVNGPKVAGSSYNVLNGVSCTGAAFCVAVGSELDAHTFWTKTVVEQWNGKTWSTVASPNPSSTSHLEAVSCSSTTSCSAVGDYSSRSAGEAVALFEHWNGRSWSVVAGPRTTAPNPRLTGVSCPSSKTCLTLGSVDTGLIDSSTVIAARWDGKELALVAPATLTTRSDGLGVVSCTGATSCFAVGSFDNSTNAVRPQALIERWNGKTWSTVAAAPSATGTGGWLSGVSCTSSTSCLAVGASVTFISGGYYRQKTLVERWDGKRWSVVASVATA